MVSHRAKLRIYKLTLPPVIPYQAPVVKENPADFNSAMSSTIPMAAMFTRNKYIGWYV